MISERELRIVLELRKKIMTADELAKIISVSSKTIRRDIVNMEKEISNYGAQIVKKPGVGYLLYVTNIILFSEFIKETESAERLPNTAKERIDYTVFINVNIEMYKWGMWMFFGLFLI